MNLFSEMSVFFSTGVTFRSYDVTLKSQMQLCVSIMKRLWYGHEEMESRIIVEVKDMLRIIREKEGRPFDNTHLLLGCVSNVLLSMLFGRRFEHSDKDFQQAFDDVRTHMSKLSFQFDIFPLLRHLPRYKRNAEVSSNCSRRIIDFLTPNIAYSLQVSNWRGFTTLKFQNLLAIGSNKQPEKL